MILLKIKAITLLVKLYINQNQHHLLFWRDKLTRCDSAKLPFGANHGNPTTSTLELSRLTNGKSHFFVVYKILC